MPDETGEFRKAMIACGIPEATVLEVMINDEPFWDTEQVKAEFEILGFLAPFVRARRKSDNAIGTMMFTHMPRYYFRFVTDETLGIQ